MTLFHSRKCCEKTRYRMASCVFLLFIFYGFFSAVCCHYYALEKKLEPDDAEFISKVRYIISERQKKAFLDLPDENKPAWIEEFWKERDPDPETERNELKEEYFKRIAEATEMFASESKSGWITDRGRIYILYGPPRERIFLPMGQGPRGMCGETWYYGDFPIFFLDETCTQQFKLMTFDLSGVQEYSLLSKHALNPRFPQSFEGKNNFLSFVWRVHKSLEQEARVEGTVFIEVPYKSIWFSDKNEKLVTTLDLQLELQNARGDLVWEFKDHYAIETTVNELKTNPAQMFSIEVPFVLTSELDSLDHEGNRFVVYLFNQTGGEDLRKVVDFTIKRLLGDNSGSALKR